MEKYLLYSFCQVDELTANPSVAFDACGIYRMDVAAEQHMQRLASRNIFVRENSVLPPLLALGARAGE